MTHQRAVRRQLQLQRRFGGFGTERQFVALHRQAQVTVTVQIDIELVRRQMEQRAVAGECVQLDFLQGCLAHGQTSRQAGS